MSEPFVAQISMFGFNFAPRGWAFCRGQLLPLSQNTALFSLLGTTYGGDGKSNFALPNMQGNAPMHPGQGPGLSYLERRSTQLSETQPRRSTTSEPSLALTCSRRTRSLRSRLLRLSRSSPTDRVSGRETTLVGPRFVIS